MSSSQILKNFASSPNLSPQSKPDKKSEAQAGSPAANRHKLGEAAESDDEEEDDDDEDEDADPLQARRPSVFSGIASVFSAPNSPGTARSNRSDQRSARRQKYQEAMLARSKTSMVEDDERSRQPQQEASNSGDLAAGEEAMVRHREALLAASASRMVAGGFSHHGKIVSPICKNVERLRGKADRAASKALASMELPASQTPCSRLSEWFDAGLRRGVDGNLEGKRRLPPNYITAAWATANVPLVQHQQTGTIVWPMRLDLTPYFQEQHRELNEKVSNQSTTVYHYTTGPGMKMIVRPSEHVEECTVQEPHEWGEEIWDRLEEDLEHNAVPAVPEAPEYALNFVASEPAKLETKIAILKAVYRDEPMAIPAKVGHCVALLVPVDQCVAVSGRLNKHTVVVVPPGEDGLSDYEDAEDEEAGGEKKKLVSWSLRRKLLRRGAEKSLEEKVQALDLLDGVVDRNTGRTLVERSHKDMLNHEDPTDEHGESDAADLAIADQENNHGKDSPHHKRKGSKQMKTHSGATDVDEVEEAFLAKYEVLRNKRARLVKKISTAEKALKRHEEGMEVPVLVADAHRLEQLKFSLVKMDQKIERIKHEFAATGSDAVIELGVALAMTVATNDTGEPANRDSNPSALVTSPDGELILPRRKKRNRNVKRSEFSKDVRDTVNEIGEVYQDMQGDIFREVFGGSVMGVQLWLKQKGDPNTFHDTTGWTPLLMATSAGDPRIVNMLLDFGADPRVGSKGGGMTPMHLAVQKSTTEMMQAILNVNELCVRDKTHDGCTPLFLCIQRAPPRVRDEMVQMMIASHADANSTNKEGWSPFALAVTNNYRLIVKLLMGARGNVLSECPKPDGQGTMTIWQAASRYPGMQQFMKGKLSSRDMHLIEKRFPGSLGKHVPNKKVEED